MIRVFSFFLTAIALILGGESNLAQGSAPLQQALSTAPTSPAAAAPLTPISASEIDALATDLVPLVAEHNFSKVVVFGALGPKERITPMGLPVGDAFSEALAKRAQGFTVIDRSVLRATLKQQRVAEKMLSTHILADWIGSIVKADCIAMVELEDFSPPKVTIAIYLYDPRKKESKSFANRKVVIQLNADQSEVVQATIETPIAKLLNNHPGVASAGTNGVTYPTCEFCPPPDYPWHAGDLKKQGGVWLQVTVMVDGHATDIEITQPTGNGLDAKAVEAIQKWRFGPAKDSNGKAVSVVTSIQIQFQTLDQPVRIN